MSSTFSVVRGPAPDYVYRWPITTRNLSQDGDAYNMSQAAIAPDLSQALTNYQGVSNTPVLSPPSALTEVAEGLSMDLPITAQPGPFSFGFRTFASRILLSAEVFHLGSADARDGFGLVMSDGALAPASAAPSLATAAGGIWFRRPAVVFQWECERYLAAGALTGSTSFQVNPAGETAEIEVDIRRDPAAGALAIVKAGGAGSQELPDVGEFRFDGADLPSFVSTGWFLGILQHSSTNVGLRTRGSLSVWYD